MTQAGLPAYRVEALGPDHDVSAFRSGEVSLDRWLERSALGEQKRGSGRTFVLLDPSDPARRVVACYTLAAHVIESEELSSRLARGMPRQLPAVLLGRLAVDGSLQGHGMGGEVLAEAVSRVVRLSTEVGMRFLVVDALSARAAGSYRRYGFTPVPGEESMRLVLKVSGRLLTG